MRYWQVTRDAGTFPTLGRTLELYYLKTDGTMVAVPVETNAARGRLGTPCSCFGGRTWSPPTAVGRHYDAASDGRFVMIKETRDTAATSHFVIVQTSFVKSTNGPSERRHPGRVMNFEVRA
ncbi:MAG TPA: hypothetical protein VH679_14000 [Vicinamibacterales bacterium]